MYFSSPLYQEDIRRAARVSFLPWESLQGESALITGATGLIGTCLIDILMERSRLFPESPIHVLVWQHLLFFRFHTTCELFLALYPIFQPLL